MTKILLLSCPLEIPDGVLPRTFPPLGCAYLASSLERHGHRVAILDTVIGSVCNKSEISRGMVRVGMDEKEIANSIKGEKPDILGISTQFIGDASQAHALARLIKEIKKDFCVVVGGHYPSVMPFKCLEDNNIDFICIGEAEDSFPKFVANFEKRGHSLPENFFNHSNCSSIIQGAFPAIKCLDELPFPDRNLLSMEKYFDFFENNEIYKTLNKPATTIMATRGCPNKCSFCMHSAARERNYQTRSIQNLKAEIEYLIENYGIRELLFVDENLTHDRNYSLALAKMLSEYEVSWYMLAGTAIYSLTPELLKALRKSGCYRIRFTVESASPKVLKMMRKSVDISKAESIINVAKGLGFLTQGQFIIGMPYETKDDIRITYEWARKMDFDYTTFGIVTPYPGTPVFEDAVREGYLCGDNDDLFKMYCGFGRLRTPEFTPEELESYRKEFWKEINFASEGKKNRMYHYFNPREFY